MTVPHHPTIAALTPAARRDLAAFLTLSAKSVGIPEESEAEHVEKVLEMTRARKTGAAL